MHSIAAVSTPSGIGGIAVIRLSGDDAFTIADRVWKGSPISLAPSHTARLGIITDSDGGMLDQAVATVFAEGHSFTGEPTVEFSVHGSRWIQRRVVERLIEAGASAAAPGEFTRRAFINGRIDLAQAEGVADMIAASSKAAQRLAAAQMKGQFSLRLRNLRDSIIQLASLLELELDFSEEDVEFADRSKLLDLTLSTRDEISRLAASFRTGRALKEGVAVVIAGRPNAGKSTLLNCLLQDDKAIISDIPGTTRDIIEDTAEINGILFRFIDTAGLRETSDQIEQIGLERARQAINKADIILHLIDSTDSSPIDSPDFLTTLNDAFQDSADTESTDSVNSALTDSNDAALTDTNNAALTDSNDAVFRMNVNNVPTITLFTKSDLSESADRSELSEQTDSPRQTVSADSSWQSDLSDSSWQSELSESSPIRISAKTGAGIPELISRLTHLAGGNADRDADIIITNSRHYEALLRATEALDRVADGLNSLLPADLIAQDLREATHHLATITGDITPTDLLQSVFSRFCIGK